MECENESVLQQEEGDGRLQEALMTLIMSKNENGDLTITSDDIKTLAELPDNIQSLL